jgi:hypothetical protein
MVDQVRKTGTLSVVTSGANLSQTAAQHDTDVQTAQTTFLAAPPAGYQAGTLNITSPTTNWFDGKLYNFQTGFTYITNN